MNNFLQQDIFFFVTTVSVLLVAVLVGFILFYVYRIVKTVDYISKKVKDETDIISAELGELRANIRKEGVKVKHFTKFFSRVRKSK
jgi:hypothetical protein